MMKMSMGQLKDAETRLREKVQHLDRLGYLENVGLTSVSVDLSDIAAIVWLLDTAREYADYHDAAGHRSYTRDALNACAPNDGWMK